MKRATKNTICAFYSKLNTEQVNLVNQVKMIIVMYFNSYLSKVKFDLDLVFMALFLHVENIQIRFKRIYINSLAALVGQSGSGVWRERTP